MIEKDDNSKSGIAIKITISFFIILLFFGISIVSFSRNILEKELLAGGVSYELLANALNSYILFSTAIIIFVILFSCVAAYFIVHAINRPIKKLEKAALEFSNGNFDYKTKVQTNDEWTILADSFNKAGEEIQKLRKIEKNYNIKLENEVETKTSELKNLLKGVEFDKDEMNKQRAAILNILEDTYEAQQSIKDTNVSLESRQKELEAIAELSKKLSMKIGIDGIMNTVREFVGNFLDFNSICFYIFSDNKNIKVVKRFLNKKTGINVLRGSEKVIADFLHSENKNEKKEDIEKSFQEALAVNPKDKIVPGGNFEDFEIRTYKLVSGGNIMGAFCLLVEKNKLNKDVDRILNTVSSAVSVAIAGVRAFNVSERSKTESLVYSLSNGIIMYDENQRVVLVNPAANLLTGIKTDGTGMDNFLNAAKAQNVDFSHYLSRAIKQGEYSHVEVLNINESYFEVFINPVTDAVRKRFGAALIIHDITQIKLIDRMKTEFVSVASHQLRTPLTAIKLFTEMLIGKEVGELNKDQQEYLENVYESTERMVRLVNDLLNVTRIESGRLSINPEPTEVNKFLKSVISEANPLARLKKISIDFKVKGKIPVINLDVNLVRQVFHNLITNAIRYSGQKNGRIKITLEKRDAKNILISIGDNGIGIPEKVQKRIFEKFYRADNAVKVATEGTGLGLYVSKMIIEQSDGKIWFESKQGKGTVFFVRLPVKGMKKIEGERGLAIS